MYFTWAILPAEALHQLGVTYYPDKWWALAIPTLLVVLAFVLVTLYVGCMLINTEPLDSFATLRDDHTRDPAEKVKEKSIPPLYDIPITAANALLFPAPLPGSPAAGSGLLGVRSAASRGSLGGGLPTLTAVPPTTGASVLRRRR